MIAVTTAALPAVRRGLTVGAGWGARCRYDALMKSAKNLLWVVFAGFVVCALWCGRHEPVLKLDRPMVAGKLLIWTAFAGFLAYTIYCSLREDLFRSIRAMAALHWGRQVGLDLYLGLSLSLLLVYLNEGPLAALLWLVPTCLFGNLATLLYFAIHYDSLVTRLVHSLP